MLIGISGCWLIFLTWMDKNALSAPFDFFLLLSSHLSLSSLLPYNHRRRCQQHQLSSLRRTHHQHDLNSDPNSDLKAVFSLWRLLSRRYWVLKPDQWLVLSILWRYRTSKYALNQNIIASALPKIGSFPTNNQPNMEFQFNMMMGNMMTDCNFYVPNLTGDITGLAFHVVFDDVVHF